MDTGYSNLLQLFCQSNDTFDQKRYLGKTFFGQKNWVPGKSSDNEILGQKNLCVRKYFLVKTLMGEGFILLTRGYGFMRGGCTTPLLTR